MTTAQILNIGELVDAGEADLQTGPFGTQFKASEYVASGIPMINVKNIGFGRTRRHDDLDQVGPETVDRLSQHLIQKDDIIFGRKGAVERHAFISTSEAGWIQGSDCLRLRINSQMVDPRFVSYFLLTEYHKNWIISQCSHGATMSSLNQGVLRRISLPLPDLPTQRKIARSPLGRIPHGQACQSDL